MLKVPGSTLIGAIKATGTHLLFHAVRDADGLPLILKTPTASKPGSRESERFRHEFAILQRLSDVRGVTRVHACERLQARPVLLMEEIEGAPLSELTGKPFEVARALDLAVSLASILAELHRRGVIHREEVGRRLELVEAREGPYLYRYICAGVAASVGEEVAVLEAVTDCVFEAEQRGIAEGVLKPVGLRLVARRS